MKRPASASVARFMIPVLVLMGKEGNRCIENPAAFVLSRRRIAKDRIVFPDEPGCTGVV